MQGFTSCMKIYKRGTSCWLIIMFGAANLLNRTVKGTNSSDGSFQIQESETNGYKGNTFGTSIPIFRYFCL